MSPARLSTGPRLGDRERDERDLAILRDMDAGMNGPLAAVRYGVSLTYPRALRRRVLTDLARSEAA